MCFEWDKRYFRELEEKKNKEKVDSMIKNAETAAKASRENSPAVTKTDQVKENVPV